MVAVPLRAELINLACSRATKGLFCRSRDRRLWRAGHRLHDDLPLNVFTTTISSPPVHGDRFFLRKAQTETEALVGRPFA